MSYHWSTTPYVRLYESIQAGTEDQLFQISELKLDLSSLLLHPKKNDESRKKVESGKVKFEDGLEYELNEQFKLDVIRLSDDLQLDELVSAQLLHFVSINEFKDIGISSIDSAKAAYYTRRQYILQIVTYYVCTASPFSKNLVDSNNYLSKVLLESFKSIESELDFIKQLIEKAKILNSHNNLNFVKSVDYRRDSLFKEYQLLGELLSGYVAQNSLKLNEFNEILNHFTSFEPDDIFIIPYIPSMFHYLSGLQLLPESDVKSLHKQFMNDIGDSDKLANTPVKALLILVFLTNFIEWCKIDDKRTKEYEFSANVDGPMRKTFTLGSLEQFMSIASDTSLVNSSIDSRIQLFYDFRPFLQQHIPRMTANRLLDVDEAATGELKRTLQQQRLNGATVDENQFQKIYNSSKPISLESHFVEFCAPILSSFVHSFIMNAAFILTYLRDMEEDFLLSGEDFDLELLAENAELERFYLAMFYLYASREELASEFWADKTSTSYGFLQWASRCNSPLIISTFCLVLSALATGDKNSIHTFNFLQITNTSNEQQRSDSSSLINKYSSVSWSTIYSSLNYYNTVLSSKPEISKVDLLTVSAPFQLNNSEESPIPELGEDSIIFISGFFQVISEVARNSSKAKNELLKSDNYELLTILTDFLKNATSLGGQALIVLSSLINDDYADRKKVWTIIDDWIFGQASGKRTVNTPLKDAFRLSLRSFSEINGFACLLSELLKPSDDSEKPFDPIDTPYPIDLGSRTRKQGIWIYLEYLSAEVFVKGNSNDISQDQKTSLILTILTIWERSLLHLDPNLVINATACKLKDLDNITANKSIIKYLQSNAGSAVMNFMYVPGVHDALFQIASLGIDKLNELSSASKDSIIVTKSLDVIEMVLEREKFYIDELLSIIVLPDNPFYMPYDVGTSGFSSFFDTLLLHLPFVAHISLYVGSSNLQLAHVSLKIFTRLINSATFNGVQSSLDNNLLSKNRLLTMLETVDESTRIRYAFIDQFESPIWEPESIGIKIELLQMLINTLNNSNFNSSIAHFLLGYDTKKMTFGRGNEKGTINSSRSLLMTLVSVLLDTLNVLCDSSNILYAPVKICTLILQLLLKLCKSSFAGSELMKRLRDSNLFMFLLKSSKKVYVDATYWNGKKFVADFSTTNKFSTVGESALTLIDFINYRNLMLQMIALELHTGSRTGSISLIGKYFESLASTNDYVSGAPKVLELLDVLEFMPKNMIEKADQLFSNFDFEYILQRIDVKTEPLNDQNNNSPFVMTVVDDLVGLFGKESQAIGLLRASESSDNSILFNAEKVNLKKILANTITFDTLKSSYFQLLHSWVILVQILVTDSTFNTAERTNFILEVFQYVIPKINDFIKTDVSCAEDLISLCVSLFHSYEKDRASLFITAKEQETSASLDSTRLFPLFAACVMGIVSPQSTPSIRSDLYVLANSYIQQAMINRGVVTDLMIYVRSMDQILLGVICNDSLVGDGPCRITALIFLESLLKVMSLLQGANSEGNFMLDVMCKSNYLLQLVQKLKSADEMFRICLDGGKKGVTLQSLLYELTAFKTCIYFLVRLGQARFGAQQLLNCDIFKVIKDCKFLNVDADLGFELNMEEYGSTDDGSEKFIKMNISLDTPLMLTAPDYNSNNSLSESISYYEIFIPVFQLINTVVISLGPQNEASLNQASELKDHFSKLITAVLKREIIIEDKLKNQKSGDKCDEDVADNDKNGLFHGLRELSNLFTLLDSLV